MSPFVFILTALAGGLGAACRLAVESAVRERAVRRQASGRFSSFAWGTMLVNVTGSFGLGAVLAAGAAGALPESLALIAGAGFFGGYTTFSTASFETVRQLREGHIAEAVTNGLGMLVLAVGAAAAGWAACSAVLMA